MFNTPILFLIFKRLETTQKVFSEIRKIQPKQFFIAADGPRVDKKGEKEETDKVRKFVIDNIDWDCEVKTLFREQNFGCGQAISQAITWFFEHVEQGIILEDDTLPHNSFFKFCEELLEYYKNEDKVMSISGYCRMGKFKPKNSYSFVEGLSHIWGWATWKKTWDKYDFSMQGYDTYRQEHLINNPEKQTLMKILDEAYHNKIDSWAYRFAFTCEQYQGLTAESNTNLIKNLGMNDGGTHTTNWELAVYEPSQYKLTFPIKHPKKLEANKDYLLSLKKQTEKQQLGQYSRFKMLKLRLKRYLKII